MPESDLAKKLKLKAGLRAVIVSAPENYLSELQPLPDGVTLDTEVNCLYQWVQVCN